MASNDNKVYPSKIDWWLAIILIATPLSPIGLGIYFLVTIGWLGLVAIIMGVLVGWLMVALLFPCYYTLTSTQLIIKYGMNKDVVELRRVMDAIPSSNPLSAPALSLKRVKIILDKGFVLISPENRDTFISDLKNRLEIRS